MTPGNTEAERIVAEYASRERRLPADRYSWSQPYNRYAYRSLWDSSIRLLSRHDLFPLDGRRVLDVGCGRGQWLLEFVQWGARPSDVCGIDLLPARVEAARESLPGADIRLGDANLLPWAEESFDLVAQFTVFSSLLEDASRRNVAREIVRTLKPGGAVLWYDMAVNNPANSMVRGIGDTEIRSLFPGCEIESRKVTLAPPIGRVAARCGAMLATLLESVPVLRTHRLALIRKPR